MFIALVRFPDIPNDRDDDFGDWFTWSNQQLAGTDGLHSRRLLRSTNGHYAALVEHESAASFAAMHAAPVVAQIQARLHQIVPESPHATQFNVVIETTAESGVEPASGRCCAGGGNGHHHPQAVAQAEALAPGQACCHAG